MPVISKRIDCNKICDMNTLEKFREKYQQLEQLNESRREFIENLLAAFERDHPEFIEHLKECGLDEEEIRYCCLEVLGIKDENL